MFFDKRTEAISSLIARHVSSPSLRHVRDPKTIHQLARDIVREIDQEPTVWRKWDVQREVLLKAASHCWVPVEDLREFLNGMPGPKLTQTDVAQRLRAFQEEPYEIYPEERVQAACLGLYEIEKAAGTELPAIIGALQEFAEIEEERLRKEHEDRWRRQREEERVALEQRFLAGADCKWTPLNKSQALFIRKNGRAYRLDQEKTSAGTCTASTTRKFIGTYGTRGDVNKALMKLAYEPEPRW